MTLPSVGLAALHIYLFNLFGIQVGTCWQERENRRWVEWRLSDFLKIIFKRRLLVIFLPELSVLYSTGEAKLNILFCALAV